MARRFFKRWYLVILIIFALALPLVSFGSSLEYFRLSSGVKEFFKTVSDRGQRQTNTSVADYNITNNCGLDYFAPNNSKLEWDSFLANKPSCLVQTYAFCGDTICQSFENASNCNTLVAYSGRPGDCVSRCSDGLCTVGETNATCSAECPAVCGDGYCATNETYATCPGDCPCTSTGCGIDTCGFDNCGNSCGTCNTGESCIQGLCCKMNATISACGDRDTYVYFNGQFVNQSVETSPLMTNTVSNVRSGYNYVQIKVYDNGPVFWGGNNFALSAGITYTGCRGKSGSIYYHSNTTDLYNWRCTNSYTSLWNSYNPFPISSSFYSVPTSVLSTAAHSVSSWCNKNSFYGAPSHQIWANTGKSRSNSETIYCYHRFDLESIVSSGKSKLSTYWCGDGVCNSTEDYNSCSLDCLPPAFACGNYTCEVPYEDYNSCSIDCSGYCGDAMCDLYEDYYSCSSDCAYGCGDGYCDSYEDPDSCSVDCATDYACGDGYCDSAYEDYYSCPGDCPY